jgi:hypothetical protein
MIWGLAQGKPEFCITSKLCPHGFFLSFKWEV